MRSSCYFCARPDPIRCSTVALRVQRSKLRNANLQSSRLSTANLGRGVRARWCEALSSKAEADYDDQRQQQQQQLQQGSDGDVFKELPGSGADKQSGDADPERCQNSPCSICHGENLKVEDILQS